MKRILHVGNGVVLTLQGSELAHTSVTVRMKDGDPRAHKFTLVHSTGALLVESPRGEPSSLTRGQKSVLVNVLSESLAAVEFADRRVRTARQFHQSTRTMDHLRMAIEAAARLPEPSTRSVHFRYTDDVATHAIAALRMPQTKKFTRFVFDLKSRTLSVEENDGLRPATKAEKTVFDRTARQNLEDVDRGLRGSDTRLSNLRRLVNALDHPFA